MDAQQPQILPPIRPTTRADVPSLKRLIDTLGLFPGEMLDDMMNERVFHPFR